MEKAERVGAIFNAEHHPFVAHDGSQAAGLTGFLGDLLEVGGGDGHDAFAGETAPTARLRMRWVSW